MLTSDLAPVVLAGALGGKITSKTVAEDIIAWCAARRALLDFEPKPGKPGVPGLPEGSGGWAALEDLEKNLSAWAKANIGDNPVSPSDLEAAQAELGNSTWLCEPDARMSEAHRDILEG